MSSPFPGMNPYLEDPELWSEFHSRMIVAIADALDELLNRQYWVAVEKRVYLSQEVVELMTVELPALQEVQERYLEIREGTTGSVFTVLQLLSPQNKRSGEGRDAYLQKRQQVLASTTHLVEIDLLQVGKPALLNPDMKGDVRAARSAALTSPFIFQISNAGKPMPMKGLERTPYRILMSRSPQRPQTQLYGFGLRQSIPVIPIPLQLSETEPLLDLQPLLHRIYDRDRFELVIDYRTPPKPTVSAEDWQWLQTFTNGSAINEP